MLTQGRLGVLWPAFRGAAAAELVFLALVDPADLAVFGVPVAAGRMPVYTIGFFFFWAIAAAATPSRDRHGHSARPTARGPPVGRQALSRGLPVAARQSQGR